MKLLVKGIIALMTAGTLMSAACSSTGSREGGDTAVAERHSPAVIPPEIPAELTEPMERAEWLALHYWDLVDFSDRSLSLDTAYMEQSFVNWLPAIDLTGDSIRSLAVGRLMDRVSVERGVYEFVIEIAERYLYDPESPVYDEGCYLPFVEWRLARDPEDERLLGEREQILKNSPGSIAPDFVFLGRDGARSSLREVAQGRSVLLVFYSPDCEQCEELEMQLATSQQLRELQDRGLMRVVFIYQGEEGMKEEWLRDAGEMPGEWVVGIDDRGEIDEEELYIVRATPSIYLIQPDGRIGVKDGGIIPFRRR